MAFLVLVLQKYHFCANREKGIINRNPKIYRAKKV